MLKYIIKRIIFMIPTVLVISILTFVVIQLPREII
jgi:ABC-type dipeptide/oligopeptide/nickel transport system permease component